jgi:chemotaxis protein histidine kinase CheA
MTRKVGLEHKSGVTGRVGHIIDSYYADGFIKQDFLLLDEKAIGLWDNGFLDDVSVHATGKVKLENSPQRRIVVTSLKGKSSDFVDKPACKACGLDVLLEELEKEENIELEDNDMSDKEDVKEFKSLWAELSDKVQKFLSKDEKEVELEDKEETPVEEETEEEQVEEPEDKDESEDETPEVEEESEDEKEIESEEELSESDEGGSMTDVKEIEVKLEQVEKYEKELEVKLSKVEELEKTYEAKIKEAELKLSEADTKDAQTARNDLIKDLKEVSGKFKVELSEEEVVELSDLEKTEDATVQAKIDTYNILLQKIPEGELPNLLDVSLEETTDKIEDEIKAIEEKGKNLFMG